MVGPDQRVRQRGTIGQAVGLHPAAMQSPRPGGKGDAGMFTGIVEEIGEVSEVRESADVVVFTVRGRTVTSDAHHGDSIAVNGVCLTVVDPDGSTGGTFTVELVPETLKRSSL